MRKEIYRKAIANARELMREKTKENKAPAWKLTELTQKVGKDLAKEFNVDTNIVLLTLYLQHLIFEPTVGGEIQKNHPALSAKYVEDTNILEKWNIPEEDRPVILEAIRVHHNKNINSNLTVEVIKNAECQKFVTIEGALIWLHELGIRENDYESSKELVFYKMNQKKELLTLEKCIERGENSCNKIKSMFEDKNIIPQLKKLHKLGLDKIVYEDAIKKIDFKFDL